MPTDIKLPALSEGVNEGTVAEVRVKAGDALKKGDALLVVEAEKSTLEVPSDVAGTVTEVLVTKGDVVKTDQVIARVEAGADAPAKKAPAKESKAAEKDAKSPEKEAAAKATKMDVEEPKKKPVPATVGRNGNHSDAPRSPAHAKLVPAGPATRRLARKLNVALESVTGSGPRGRVTQDDVIAYSQRAGSAGGGSGVAAPPLPDFARWGDVEFQPLELIRRKTAEQMAVAWSQVPHVTQHDLADITDLEAFRKEQATSKSAPKITVTAFALKAAAVALREFPHFNASLDLAGSRLVRKQYVHVGVAVDTDRGLLVPVIRDVDKKSVRELAAEVTDIAERARQRKLPLDEMKGGTFTITNLGGIGGVGFTPIVNWPEVAIIGLSRARLEPVWRDGAFAPRLMMPLSLSYDHRVIDGADGARFTRRIAAMLENPLLLLLDA